MNVYKLSLWSIKVFPRYSVYRVNSLENGLTFAKLHFSHSPVDSKFFSQHQIFPAVLRALKSRVARLALTQELSYHIRSNRAVLEHQQFDLVVKLLNCCLQNDSSMDENGVAAAILPLATTFCRVRLSKWGRKITHIIILLIKLVFCMLFAKNNNVQVMFCVLFLIFQTTRFFGKVHEDYNTLMITLLETCFPSKMQNEIL